MARRQPLMLTKGMAVVTCRGCGFDWETPLKRGAYLDFCPDCRGEVRPARPMLVPGDVVVVRSEAAEESRYADPIKVEAYLKLLDYVNLRLAVEEALPLLRNGRYKDAIEVLERVPCRSRTRRTLVSVA